MKKVRYIMGMPVIVEIVTNQVANKDFFEVFTYLKKVDQRFSIYKKSSEISKINTGKHALKKASSEMQHIFHLAEKTKQETQGYFNIKKNGKLDPSGIVKGWAIENAAKILKKNGFENFYINAGGDLYASGKNKKGSAWRVGIRNPFDTKQVIKVVHLENHAIATSGTTERGQHIYNPHNPKIKVSDIVSLSVIGPTIYDADRFATAAFAMGRDGISFIEQLPGFEGYMIDKRGIATQTSRFDQYI